MKQKKDTWSFKINIGAPSIILVLVVFALTIFALLSIRASFNELKLARSSKQYKLEYYKAEAAAEKTRAELDEVSSMLFAGEDVDEDLLQRIAPGASADDKLVEYRTDIGENSWITTVLDLGSGSAQIVQRTIGTKTPEGYNASSFDVLDPVWIQFDDEELFLEDGDMNFFDEDLLVPDEESDDDLDDEEFDIEDILNLDASDTEGAD